MPGIHFVYAPDAKALLTLGESQLPARKHFEDYECEVLYRDDKTLLAFSGYAAYPRSIIETEQYLVLLEGRLYGLTETETHQRLGKLASLLFTDHADANRLLGDWLLGCDGDDVTGDYVAIAHDKESGQWVLINDPLARLPIYASRIGQGIVITRELPFAVSHLTRVTMDRMALAQQMLFEAPLGRRTLVAGVDRLPPATVIRIDPRSGTIDETTLPLLVLDRPPPTGRIETIAEDLAERFIVACGKMAPQSSPCVISLSGGLDSRSVAAGLVRTSHRPTAVTFIDADDQARADVELAEKVAGTLDLPWRLLTLPRPTAQDVDLLLRIKGGLNYTAMALGMAYLGKIRRELGSDITYFTGDGGGRVLPALSCPAEVQSSDRLARYIVDRTHLLDLKTVALLFGLSTDEILSEIVTVLDSYPEVDMGTRYLGFNLRERGMKWAMEGEDRNRAFFWSCTPFYAWSFFAHAIAAPTSMKNGNRLYRHFLQTLSPETAGIVDAKRALPVTSPAYNRKLRLISALGRYPRLMRSVKSILRRPAIYDQPATVLRVLHHQILNSENVGDYLDRAEAEQLVGQAGRWPREVFDNLLTITLMTERYQTGTDCLASFSDDVF